MGQGKGVSRGWGVELGNSDENPGLGGGMTAGVRGKRNGRGKIS